jgi:hypothetical protein
MTAPIRQRVSLPASDEAADVRRSAAGHDRVMVVVVLPAKPRHAGYLPSRSRRDRAHQRAILAPCPASGQRRGIF